MVRAFIENERLPVMLLVKSEVKTRKDTHRELEKIS